MSGSDWRVAIVFLSGALIVLICTIGAWSNYVKCEAEGGEYVRGWFSGSRCLIVEREVYL